MYLDDADQRCTIASLPSNWVEDQSVCGILGLYNEAPLDL